MNIDFHLASNEQIETELGRRIKRERVAQGLNQTELAERAGVVRRTVSSVERGEGASLTTFIALLRGLDAIRELERILPDPGPSPIALTEGTPRVKERKYPYKPRQKKNGDDPDVAKTPWKWGDEK